MSRYYTTWELAVTCNIPSCCLQSLINSPDSSVFAASWTTLSWSPDPKSVQPGHRQCKHLSLSNHSGIGGLSYTVCQSKWAPCHPGFSLLVEYWPIRNVRMGNSESPWMCLDVALLIFNGILEFSGFSEVFRLCLCLSRPCTLSLPCRGGTWIPSVNWPLQRRTAFGRWSLASVLRWGQILFTCVSCTIVLILTPCPNKQACAHGIGRSGKVKQNLLHLKLAQLNIDNTFTPLRSKYSYRVFV